MIRCKMGCPLKTFDGCCASCPAKDGCSDVCEWTDNFGNCPNVLPDEGTALKAFQNQQLAVLQQIADLVTTKKQIEAQEKELKDKLKEAMERYGITKFESDALDITYVAETNVTSVDSAKLKRLHPDIAAACSKLNHRSSYIKVTVKGGDK